MSATCCSSPCGLSEPASADPVYRRILWVALVVNAGMFGIEIAAGVVAGSVSLQADALDFLSDAGNYGVSLYVLGMVAVWRARAALLKGLSLAAIGLYVAGATLYNALVLEVPTAEVMGVIGVLALLSNTGVAVLLFAYRKGDANMRSVWICSRNDAIANVAVVIAALGVFGTGTGWPDVIVASVIAGLALWGATQIVHQARAELRSMASSPAPIAAE